MNKLVAIIGMSGSGKSVITDYLAEKGWNKIYFGGVVLDKLKENNLEITPNNEKMMRESLREKYGMAAMAIILLPKITESIKKQDTVLDGLYSWDEYLILKEKFSNLKLVCVIADKNIRYNRVSIRKVRGLNNDEIKKRDYAEIENLAKGGPIAISDYYIFNNGSIEDEKIRLEEIIKNIDEEELK